ncbi:hypothetical protein G6F43_006912 [Rhizopus delemar]|nr:hypothetical protein G6F43_006912 [Rhizopus delemar]
MTAESSDYKTVLLTALDVGNASQKEQQKAWLTAQLAQVEPFVFTDHQGEQHHLLGTFRNLVKLIESTQCDGLTESFPFFLVRNKRSYSSMNDIDSCYDSPKTSLLCHTLSPPPPPPHSMETSCKQICGSEL